MLNHKYTSRLQLLASVKRMLSKSIKVDLSDFNAVQRKWLVTSQSAMSYIRTCQRYDEYCQGCPYVNTHGGCTVGRPWKQAGKRSEQVARKYNGRTK